jgi:tetratricopeptide (TPR) repeat protein
MTATAGTGKAADPDRLAEIEGLRRRGRLGDAMSACQDMMERSPDDSRLLLLAAAISRDGRHHMRAGSYLERLIAAEPPQASIYGEAARIWRQCGNRAGAVDAYRNALRLDPAWAPAHVELAEIQAEDGQAEEAIYHLKIAIAVDPDKLDARERLAALLEGSGEGSKAAELRRETMRRARRKIRSDYTRIRTPAVAASPRTMQRHRLSWAHALLVYGTTAVGVAKFEEGTEDGLDAAAATYREALAVLAEAADQARSVAGLRRAFATASLAFSRCHYEMALVQERKGNRIGAIYHLEEALRAHGSPWDEIYEKLGALIQAEKVEMAELRKLIDDYAGQPSVPASYPVTRWDFAHHATEWLALAGGARALTAPPPGRHIAMLAASPEEAQLSIGVACVLAARGHRVDCLWLPGLRFEGPCDPAPVFDRWDELLMARELEAIGAGDLPEGFRLVDLRQIKPSEPDDAMEREAERLAVADTLRQSATGVIIAADKPMAVQRQNRKLRNLDLMRRLAAYMADRKPDRVVVMNGDMMEGGCAFWVARAAQRKVITWARCRERPSAIVLSSNRNRSDRDFGALWQADGSHELTASRRERVLSWLSGRTGGDFRMVEPRKRHLPPQKALTALAEHGIDPMRPVAVLFGDRALAAGDTDDGVVFAEDKNWILRTIEWFEGHPEWQLVARLYAQDGQSGIRSMLRDRWPDLPRNVRLAESGDAKLDYQLLEIAQVGIYRNNPIGLEMAMMGIIAVSAGRPFFANKGFTREAGDEESYFRLLRRALDGPEAAAMTDREAELAWCFADLYLNVAPKPFPWSERNFWRDVREEWPVSRVLGVEGELRFGQVFDALAGGFELRDGVVGSLV